MGNPLTRRKGRPIAEILLVYSTAGLILLVFLAALRFAFPPRVGLEHRIYFGDQAKREFYRSRELPLLDEHHWMMLAKDCYLFDGGSFSGTIKYWSCTLPTKEKCFEAMRDASNWTPTAEQLKPWGHSDYRVVMDGPGFYHPSYNTELWNVNSIKTGIFYEEADRDRWMSFWAIDLDRNRLYYHYESGGFPADRYKPPETAAGKSD